MSAVKANELTILHAARNPQWSEQSTWNVPPSSESDGVDMADRLKALLAVGLRQNAHHRSARITVDTRDASANYTVTINGTAIATTSGSFATDDAVLVEIKAKIDADATVGQAASTPVVDSELLDSSGDVTQGTAAGGNAAVTLRVFGESDTDWYITGSATGSGILACDADPVSATLKIYFSTRGSGSNVASPGPGWWAYPTTYSLAGRGYIERLDVAGLQKGYAFLDSVAGHGSDAAAASFLLTYADGPTVWWGPCALE